MAPLAALYVLLFVLALKPSLPFDFLIAEAAAAPQEER
jgi:hypothetical protein